MNSIKWLFVCLLCFSVYLLCHISHGQYSLSIQAASCVAVAFARGRCRDSVVLNVAFSTVLPFCAWLKSLCALLLHQRQRQECFFCSREYTWINTSRKALEVFWKKLIYISMSICIVFSSRVLKYPKQGKSILVCFQCGSTLSRFSSGYEPLMQEAGASLFRESGSVFLLPPPRRKRLSRGYMLHCQPVRKKPQDDHAAKWQMPNINVSLRAELTFTTHGGLPSITADGLMRLDAEKLWLLPSYIHRLSMISLVVRGSGGGN